MTDQAASLREWAAKQQRSEATASPSTTVESTKVRHRVMVLRLGKQPSQVTGSYKKVFERWAEQGKKWIGAVEQWQFVSVGPEHPELRELASNCRHWALWIDDDLDGFANAYRCLKALAETGQVKQVLALHEPVSSRRGLLSNLQQVAQQYFGLQLLVFAD